MGIPLLIGMLFLLFLLILSVTILIYVYRKGNKKSAICIFSVLFLFFLSLAFMNSIDSFTYSKKDVKKDLKFLNVELHEPFKIVENKIEGFPEYFQYTKIKISKSDKEQILNQIKLDKNFKIYDSSALSSADYQLRNIPNKTSINFLKENMYNREYYEKNEGYVGISISISIKKDSDTLVLERIEDN